jgi:serine/threonine protein kinase
LKKFPKERAKEFEREKKMLKVLADHPHPDIVPHITSWSQANEYYILYPAARYSLREYMRTVDPVPFTKLQTLWFLRQLLGLALAIDHVHKLKHPTNTEKNPSTEAYWGCHFDIKPENILVFEKVRHKHSRFKITDFGVGVFNQAGNQGARSHLTSDARGTETYFAPDKERLGRVSRPFDMWALGCVYLELMVWLFRFFDGSAGDFSTARFDYTRADPRNRTDRFWLSTPTPQGSEYKLHPIVEGKLKELKDKRCVGMPAFQQIISAVENLLKIEPDDRWGAEELKNHIERTVREAENKLENSPDFYSTQYKANEDAESLRQPPDSLPIEDTLVQVGSMTDNRHTPTERPGNLQEEDLRAYD